MDVPEIKLPQHAAARRGQRVSVRVEVGIILFIAVVLSYGAYGKFDGDGQIIYLVVVTLANITMMYGVYSAKNGEYFKGQKTIKQGMGIAILAFVLGVNF